MLAEHDDVDAVWYFGGRDGRQGGRARVGGQHEAHLADAAVRATGSTRRRAKGASSCAHATQVKNIWIPYGE